MELKAFSLQPLYVWTWNTTFFYLIISLQGHYRICLSKFSSLRWSLCILLWLSFKIHITLKTPSHLIHPLPPWNLRVNEIKIRKTASISQSWKFLWIIKLDISCNAWACKASLIYCNVFYMVIETIKIMVKWLNSLFTNNLKFWENL